MPRYKVTITRARLVWETAKTEVEAETGAEAMDIAGDEDFSTFTWTEEDCDTRDVAYSAEGII